MAIHNANDPEYTSLMVAGVIPEEEPIRPRIRPTAPYPESESDDEFSIMEEVNRRRQVNQRLPEDPVATIVTDQESFMSECDYWALFYTGSLLSTAFTIYALWRIRKSTGEDDERYYKGRRR